MATMRESDIEEVASTGTEKMLADLLYSQGWRKRSNDGDWTHNYPAIDVIMKGARLDEDEARKAAKVALVTAYKLYGTKALKDKISKDEPPKKEISKRSELKTLRRLAFNSSSERLVDLLKAQGNNKEALEAIIKGVQKDRNHFYKKETAADKCRRADKKDIIAEFYAKSGHFAVPDAQARITELETRLAEAEKTATAPAKPAALKVQ